MKLKIIQLYPKEMNIYGDNGNLLAVTHRLSQSGINYQVDSLQIGDKLPEDADIILAGGGQDSGQILIESSLIAQKNILQQLIEEGAAMLAICGSYQMLGEKFVSSKGEVIKGLGIIPVTTNAGSQRIKGNVKLMSQKFGIIYGFENHSGVTSFTTDLGQHKGSDSTFTPLGEVIQGTGNNYHDSFEGITYKNLICSYLHGPLLPKNPAITEYLINAALKRRGLKPIEPIPQSSSLEVARRQIESKF